MFHSMTITAPVSSIQFNFCPSCLPSRPFFTTKSSKSARLGTQKVTAFATGLYIARDKEMANSTGQLADEKHPYFHLSKTSLPTTLLPPSLPLFYHPSTSLRSTVAPLANVAATFVGNGGSTPPHPFSSQAATRCGNGRQGCYREQIKLHQQEHPKM